MCNNYVKYRCATCKFSHMDDDNIACLTCSNGSNFISNPTQSRNNNSVKYVNHKPLRIENVIFNDPATIVFWSDHSKTVVKAKNEAFDKEKGLAMAISKKFCGNKGNYYNIFKKWIEKE